MAIVHWRSCANSSSGSLPSCGGALAVRGRGKPDHIIAIRFISTNKICKDAKLLLAFDALALSEMLKQEVSLGKIIHGDNHATLNVKTSSLGREVRQHIAKIDALLSSPSPPNLVLIPHCAECEFQTQCRRKALQNNDLSLLSGMTEKERKKLHDKGIFTVTQLSYTFRPRRRPKGICDKREKYHHSLRALAIRQNKIHIVGNPKITIEGTPVYLDVEGLPDRDFYYLIGVRVGDCDPAVQYGLWADSVEDERKIWNEFIGLLANITDPVLIHYGGYETMFLKRMGDRYGVPPAESRVTKAIKKSVNLLSVIFAQVYFPTFSNRLKDIGHFLGATWEGPVTSGLQSLAYRLEWERSSTPELKTALLGYNRDDCAAIETVTAHLTQIVREAKSRMDVEFSDKPKKVASDKGAEIHGSFESLLRSAHFRYARSRIKLLTEKPTQLRAPEKKKAKKRQQRRSFSTIKGTIVRVPRKRVCPRGHKLTASLEAVDPNTMFAEMAGFKTEPLNVFENRNQQITNSRDKPLQFIVKGIFPKIIVQVSDQMNEAFLLRARERVGILRIRWTSSLSMRQARCRWLMYWCVRRLEAVLFCWVTRSSWNNPKRAAIRRVRTFPHSLTCSVIARLSMKLRASFSAKPGGFIQQFVDLHRSYFMKDGLPLMGGLSGRISKHRHPFRGPVCGLCRFPTKEIRATQ